jgi:hypothetical protein
MYHRASGPWTITGSLNIDSEPVCLTTLAIYTKNSPYLIHKKDLEWRNTRWPKLQNFKTKTYITSQYAQLSNKQTLIWIRLKPEVVVYLAVIVGIVCWWYCGSEALYWDVLPPSAACANSHAFQLLACLDLQPPKAFEPQAIKHTTTLHLLLLPK